MDDRARVRAQIAREPRAFLSVTVRCPFGAPAVTEQRPYDDDGTPFPTGFYLTCPQLVASVARLESGGGVTRWSEAVRADTRLQASLERASEIQRERREQLLRECGAEPRKRDGGASLALGIGASASGSNLKCLHAHVAFALAQPGYELGEGILAELEPIWPDGYCSFAERCGVDARA